MPKMFNFISRFFLFPPAKLLPADEQRPVQSAVEDEPGTPEELPFLISTVSSKLLKNILVNIFL